MCDRSYLYTYKNHLENEESASENTVSSYCRDISRFCDYLSEEKLELYEVIPDTISSYINYLKQQGKSDTTITRAIASLKSFFGYIFVEGYIGSNPSKEIKRLKTVQNMPDILTENEITLFLSQPEVNTIKGLRDKASLELLYAAGLKVSELIALDVNDINLIEGTVTCRGRGKSRVVPIHETAVSWLKKYINTARNELVFEADDNALFINMNGERITRQGFWKIIKQYQQKAGIKKDISPQMLRHSFGAHLIKNGADETAVQEMMGHSEIVSTRLYSKLLSSELKDVYNKTHPRA